MRENELRHKINLYMKDIRKLRGFNLLMYDEEELYIYDKLEYFANRHGLDNLTNDEISIAFEKLYKKKWVIQNGLSLSPLLNNSSEDVIKIVTENLPIYRLLNLVENKKLIVNGNLSMYSASRMKNVEIELYGNTGEWVFNDLENCSIKIHGNIGPNNFRNSKNVNMQVTGKTIGDYFGMWTENSYIESRVADIGRYFLAYSKNNVVAIDSEIIGECLLCDAENISGEIKSSIISDDWVDEIKRKNPRLKLRYLE